MEKLILTLVGSSVGGVFFCVLCLIFGVKIFNSICIGLLISDFIILCVYTPYFISGTLDNETFYIIIYLGASVVVYFVWFIYLFATNVSHRCICFKLRRDEYNILD